MYLPNLKCEWMLSFLVIKILILEIIFFKNCIQKYKIDMTLDILFILFKKCLNNKI